MGNPWTEEREAQLREELTRVRDEKQLLFHEGSQLLLSSPETARRLLEEALVAEGQHLDAAICRALGIHETLQGEMKKAVAWFQRALGAEEEHPKQRTMVRVDYPFLVARKRYQPGYAEALECAEDPLAERYALFPVDKFRLHAARAVMRHERGLFGDAGISAARALDVSQKAVSALENEAGPIALDRREYDDIVQELERLLSAMGCSRTAASEE